MVRPQFRHRLLLTATAMAILVAVGGAWKIAKAGDPPAPAFLQQLSDQTQQLYNQVRVGIIRVQVPPPQWLAQLNQQQRDLIVHQSPLAQAEMYRQFGAIPTSQPSAASLPNSNRELALFVVALVIDKDGHAMMPMFLDPQVVGDAQLNVRTLDGRQTRAKLIGSDQQTNISVVQLTEHSGQPVALARHRPADGSLTMVITADGGARLAVWNNLHPESGLIVLPDGSMAGFGSNGQFLATSDVQPVVDQIIATGLVRRAVLGVAVQEVAKDDAIRQQSPQLADRPAFLIVNVFPNTAAERAGLRAGDLILSINGQVFSDGHSMASIISWRSGKTDLQVMRGADVLNLAVNLQPQ